MTTHSHKTRMPLVLTGFFVILSCVLGGSLFFYWKHNLEPRLKSEAMSQASVLAQSQAALLVSAVNAPEGQRKDQLQEAVDQLLLLTDAGTGEPYFIGVDLSFDYSTMDMDKGSLDLEAGTSEPDAFEFEIPLFNPRTDELTGIASFSVSSKFQQRFISDVGWQLAFQGMLMFLLLTGAWLLLLWLVRKLERSRQQRLSMERALAENEQKFRHLVDALDHYFVYSRDAKGRITSVSDSVARVLPGITPERFVKEYPSLLLDGDDHGAARMLAEPPWAGPSTILVQVRDGSGGLHWIEHSEIAVVESGRVTGVDGIARNVTDQRRFQEELQNAKSQAERANQAKSQFLANMSHEIRTPMNAVLGLTALLQNTDLTARQRTLLNRVRSSANLLLGLLNDILDLSRIEADKLTLDNKDFHIDTLLTDLAAVIGDRAREKDIEVLFDIEAEVPRVLRGDPVRLQQVLVNLVTNAIKFTDTGEIVVAVGRQEPGETRLRFEVRDTGIGIEDNEVQRLFEPFTQGDETSTRRLGGVGLGLAICRRLVEAMGGEIEVESRPGHGSTFRFVLDFERGAGPEDIELEQQALIGSRVLVVDDNSTARSVFSSMLQGLKLQADAEESPQVALTRIEQAREKGSPYRLVLVDWKMPGMDGFELVDRVRGGPQIPPAAVLVTAYSDEELLRKAEQRHLPVLHKPVSQSTLFEAVVSALGGRLPTGTNPALAQSDRGRILPGRRALVVEDNEINREVVNEMLQAHDLSVTTANNGAEALERLEESSYDIVFMDVQMPGMDGMEVTRCMRRNPDLGELPVVALTAHAMTGDRQRCLDAGMNDYLSKPLEDRELRRVLARWLGTVEGDDAKAGPAADPLPEIDGVNMKQALERVNGNQVLLYRLLSKFQADVPGDVDNIASLISEGEVETAAGAAHALKGQASTLAVDEIASAAVRIEARLRVRRPAGDLIPLLREAIRVFVNADLEPLKPEAGEADGSRLSLGQLNHSLRELHTLLAQNSMDAVYHFDSIRSDLGDHFGELADRLSELIHSLDFSEATKVLESIREPEQG